MLPRGEGWKEERKEGRKKEEKKKDTKIERKEKRRHKYRRRKDGRQEKTHPSMSAHVGVAVSGFEPHSPQAAVQFV